MVPKVVGSRPIFHPKDSFLKKKGSLFLWMCRYVCVSGGVCGVRIERWTIGGREKQCFVDK